ncbi:MAG: VanZ family protein [Clostridiales bacterium]|nr:VanZ family protein [Clostridiales bacterium]
MKYITLLLTLLWFLLCTYLSHQPGEATAATSQRLARMLGRENWNALLRKAAHVVTFAVLSFLLSLTVDAWAVVETGEIDKRWLLAVFVWCILDEWSKRFVEGRHCSGPDCVLNLVGSLIGMVVGMVIL